MQPTAQPVSVVIVDDHVVFREGLQALFARVAEVEIVGEAATSEEATVLIQALLPDVVLMDLSIPGEGGVAVTGRLALCDPPPAVLVLTMHADDQHVRAALRAGARGYLLKDAKPDEIVRAVLAVHSGQVILDPGIAARVISATSTTSTGRPFPILTGREFEILQRVARGQQNVAIATQVALSVKTVQNNVSTIMLKLGARDRAQLVAMARDAEVGEPVAKDSPSASRR